MRRALSFVPFAPIIVACGLLGWTELGLDMHRRACRYWAEILDEIERNR